MNDDMRRPYKLILSNRTIDFKLAFGFFRNCHKKDKSPTFNNHACLEKID